MAITKILYRNGGLAQAIQYITNPDKTDQCVLVDHFNCDPGFAYQQMMNTKRRFHKTDGRQCYHIIQSFKPDEITPELAHEIGVKLATRLWGDRYQVIVATHLDKENHLHNHFVLNTVSFADGIKYHRTHKDYHEMQTVSDALCREYGLSVIEQPQQGRGKQYGEWRAEQEQPLGRRVMGLDVVDRGQRRGVHLVARGFDAQLGEFVRLDMQADRILVRGYFGD